MKLFEAEDGSIIDIEKAYRFKVLNPTQVVVCFERSAVYAEFVISGKPAGALIMMLLENANHNRDFYDEAKP